MPEKVACRETDEGEKLAISTFHIILSGPPKGDFRGRVAAFHVSCSRPSRPSPVAKSPPRPVPAAPSGDREKPSIRRHPFPPPLPPLLALPVLSFICREVTAVCQQFDCLRLHTTALDCAADCRTICPCPVAHTCLPPLETRFHSMENTPRSHVRLSPFPCSPGKGCPSFFAEFASR